MPNGSRGFCNNQEVEFITKTILSTFAHTVVGRSDEVVNIGIISFYRDQVSRSAMSVETQYIVHRFVPYNISHLWFEFCRCSFLLSNSQRSLN